MQRRAAAIYAVFFLVIAAGAYAVIGVAQEPAISLESPDQSLSIGQSFAEGGEEYTLSDIRAGTNEGQSLRSGTLTWVNESARFTATLENGSTVPASDVQWEGQTARHAVSLRNDTTVAYNGSQYRLVVAGGEDPSSFALRRGDETVEFEAGDEVEYRGNRTTVTAVTPSRVTLAWGDPYRVLVPSVADPSSFTLRQERNVTAVLAADPAVEDQPVTRADGRRYVVYEANGTTRLLDDYLPEPERGRFSEGDTLVYRGQEATIGNVTPAGVPLAWTAPRENTVSVSEGGNVTLASGTAYIAHFPDNSTLQLESNADEYMNDRRLIGHYHERINGLWAVTILSGLVAVLMIGLAYMPSRY